MEPTFYTEYLNVNNDCLRFIIGKNGHQINTIKSETDCHIFNEAGSSTFTIIGTRENIWIAKKKIITAAISGYKNFLAKRNFEAPGNSHHNIQPWIISIEGMLTAGEEDKIRFFSKLPFGSIKEDHQLINDPGKLNSISNLSRPKSDTFWRYVSEYLKIIESN